ncbi:hypothetical protein [Bosea sp. (in: a-proteobacteria)]|jgi:hypothetical protein|uniref:hypothetical protein n=1 Tax=Bosea sp. (in: a-proteobacteria) TaxID=1871050 RepID=UPI00356A4E84
MMKKFGYRLDAGPLGSAAELAGEWDEGNCRRAVQLYLFSMMGEFIEPDHVLCPQIFYQTGTFVVNVGQKFDFEILGNGDVIFAERLKNRQGTEINCGRSAFCSTDDYLISLHTALYTGYKSREIWHATAIEGSSCYWDTQRFQEFYRPVAAKRLVQALS